MLKEAKQQRLHPNSLRAITLTYLFSLHIGAKPHNYLGFLDSWVSGISDFYWQLLALESPWR